MNILPAPAAQGHQISLYFFKQFFILDTSWYNQAV